MMYRQAALILAASICVIAAGCQKEQPQEASSPPAEDCPGATKTQAEKEFHPRVLRGRVLAPHAKLAGSWTDLFVPPVHAAPLEDEQPVADATVELYRIDEEGAPTGDVLQSTTSNAKGEWCMGLPDGVEPGNDLMLRAKGAEATLRRLAISEITTDIYTGTEAIVQLMESRGVDFHSVPEQTYLNMESVADTAVDLLEPVALEDGDDVESLVARLRKTMASDERFSEKLDSLPRLDASPD